MAKNGGYSGDAGYLGVSRNELNKHPASLSSAPVLERHWIRTKKAKGSRKLKPAFDQGEHPLRYIKQVFRLWLVRYRSLAKNTSRLHLLAAFTNLVIGEKYLLA